MASDSRIEISFPDAVAALAAAYGSTSATVRDRTDLDLRRPTRCSGWTIADLLYHQLLDAQGALVAFAVPTDGEPDADAVSYWQPHKPDAQWAPAHERFVRLSTAAHSSYRTVVDRWLETSAAVVHAAKATRPRQRVTTQRHILTVPDFLSVLVVEAVFHHLDMILDLPDAPGPEPGPLAMTRSALDGMLGGAAPADWSTHDYVLAAGARVPLPDDRRRELGPLADRFPLLG